MNIIEQLKRQIQDVVFAVADIDDTMEGMCAKKTEQLLIDPDNSDDWDYDFEIASLNEQRARLELQRAKLQTKFLRAYMGAV